MNADALAQNLTDVANAVTAFAIVQNQALSYALVKREVRYRFRIRRTVAILIVWNIVFYCLPVWWCARKAIQIAMPPDGLDLQGVALWATAGRLVGIAAFGSLSILLVAVYETARHWRPSEGIVERSPRVSAQSHNELTAVRDYHALPSNAGEPGE
jgi:hypothetical protein